MCETLLLEFRRKTEGDDHALWSELCEGASEDAIGLAREAINLLKDDGLIAIKKLADDFKITPTVCNGRASIDVVPWNPFPRMHA